MSTGWSPNTYSADDALSATVSTSVIFQSAIALSTISIRRQRVCQASQELGIAWWVAVEVAADEERHFSLDLRLQ